MTGDKDLDYWRRYFSSERCNIFEIIEFGIMVAAVDCPNEFRLRRSRIAELLFSCESKRCVGCDHVELCVPLLAENDDDDDDGRMRSSEGSRQLISYGDVDALNEEIEEESQLVREVLRIKDVLMNRNESEKELYDSLRRLQYTAITVDILKSTEIGKAVNGLRRHSSSNVSHLAKLLIQVWKEMVDAWVEATTQIVEENNEGTPDSINPSVLDEEEGLPSPPMDEGAFFATPQNMELSQFFDGMDDDGNLRKSGEFSKNYSSGRNTQNENQNIRKRKLHPNNDNVFRKDHSSLLHEQKNQATISQSEMATTVKPGPDKPRKPNTEPQTSSFIKQRQASDKSTPVQRKPLTGHHDKSKPLEGNLEAMKRRLHESYQEAENAKRQRTIQVLDTIPKQAGTHLKKSQGSRSSNLNRQRLLNRR